MYVTRSLGHARVCLHVKPCVLSFSVNSHGHAGGLQVTPWVLFFREFTWTCQRLLCHALGVVFFMSSHGHAVFFEFTWKCQRPVCHALVFVFLRESKCVVDLRGHARGLHVAPWVLIFLARPVAFPLSLMDSERRGMPRGTPGPQQTHDATRRTTQAVMFNTQGVTYRPLPCPCELTKKTTPRRDVQASGMSM